MRVRAATPPPPPPLTRGTHDHHAAQAQVIQQLAHILRQALGALARVVGAAAVPRPVHSQDGQAVVQGVAVQEPGFQPGRSEAVHVCHHPSGSRAPACACAIHDVTTCAAAAAAVTWRVGLIPWLAIPAIGQPAAVRQDHGLHWGKVVKSKEGAGG
jgi:hypothetical protein